MGNAFVAGLKNEAPRGRDITNEDRNSEVSQRGTQRDVEGSEFSYIGAQRGPEGAEVKSEEELRRGRPTSPPVRRSLFGEESPEDAGREASLGSPDLFSPTLVPTSPLDSAYETGRKTPSCCPVEPDTNIHDEAGVVYEAARSSRTVKKREKDADASPLRTSSHQRRKHRRQLTFGTSEDSESVEENQSLYETARSNRTVKKREEDADASSLRTSPQRTMGTARKKEKDADASPLRTSPKRTIGTAKKREKDGDASYLRTTPQQRRRHRRQLTFGTSEDSESEEENRSPTKTKTKHVKSSRGKRGRSRSSLKKMRLRHKARASSKKKTPQKKQSIQETETEESSSFESDSSSEDGQVARPRHILKPPKFDGLKPFETFWAQFKNCAEYNQWNRSQKLVYLRSSLNEDVANILWDYGKEVTDSVRLNEDIEEALWRKSSSG